MSEGELLMTKPIPEDLRKSLASAEVLPKTSDEQLIHNVELAIHWLNSAVEDAVSAGIVLEVDVVREQQLQWADPRPCVCLTSACRKTELVRRWRCEYPLILNHASVYVELKL
jgi:hypothetical protein